MGVRISREQAREWGIELPPKESKYRNKRVVYKGIPCDSQAEAQRYAELDLLIESGHILDWVPHPVYRLGVPENVYEADAIVIANPERGEPPHAWVEDVKGVQTAKFARDVKLWRQYGRLPLRIINAKNGRWVYPERVKEPGRR